MVIAILMSLAFQYQAAVDTGKLPTVESVLQQVHQNIDDENYDNEINCVDYAMLFYDFCPTSKIVMVHKGNIHHAFIKYRGQYIEPQAKPYECYDALEIWKGKFDESDIVECFKYYDWTVRKRWDYTETGWKWRHYYYIKEGS